MHAAALSAGVGSGARIPSRSRLEFVRRASQFGARAPTRCRAEAQPAPKPRGAACTGTPSVAQRFVKCVPPGDERERNVCDTCGYVEYVNPKVVVGCLPIYTDDEGLKRVLLCRRAIEPRLGKWGFPQGFMELGESARGGAARESQEEAGAFVVVGPLLSVYNLPGQVQLLYLATMECDWNLCDAPDGGPTLELGPESSEARFFAFDELPDESELAFPTVKWALDFARDVGIPAWDDRVGFAPQQRTKMFFGSWTDKVAFEEEDPILGWGAQKDEVTF